MKKLSTVIFLLVLIILLLLGCQKSSNEKLETQEKEIPVTTVVTEPSSDWVEYRNNESGVYSYKKINIDKEGIVQVWVNQIFSDKSRENIIQKMKVSGISTEGLDKLSEKRMLIEQDCKKHRERILSMTLYDSNGKVLQSYEDPNTDWKDIILVSPEGVSHKIFCK